VIQKYPLIPGSQRPSVSRETWADLLKLPAVLVPPAVPEDGMFINLNGVVQVFTNGAWIAIGGGAAVATRLALVPPTVPVLQPGQTAVNVYLAWTRNKLVTVQTLVRSPGSVVLPIALADVSYDDLGVNYTSLVPASLQYVLTSSDGASSDVQEADVFWYWLRMWGVSAQAVPDAALLASLSSEPSPNVYQTRTLTAASQYLYFAWPTSFGGSPAFYVSNMLTNAWVKTVVSFTNAYGVTTSYDVYRSLYLQVGEYTTQVVDASAAPGSNNYIEYR
jgi:hypothetical protein